MAIFSLTIGIAGFFFCTAFHSWVDQRLPHLGKAASRILQSVKAAFSANPSEPDDHLLIARLIAQIRAGISLDSALEALGGSPELSKEARRKIGLLLDGRPHFDSLSVFLAGALRSGVPVLATLQLFQRILRAQRRVKLRAKSLTSQSRAQAEVLSWMPWLMMAGLLFVDPEWLVKAAGSSVSWLCWALALLLVGLGRSWMRKLLHKALSATSKEEIMQENFLPDLTMALISQVSLGLDAETALEKSLNSMPDCSSKAAFRDHTWKLEAAESLKHLISQAAMTGAPIREDLQAFLADLHLTTESRWEERAQRLPVVMMAPLFLCFFPSSLAILASLIFPIAAEIL